MQGPPRESGLKRFWSAVRSSNDSSCSQCEQDTTDSRVEEAKPLSNCSLPLLQVWPSSDSPRGEADGQSFVFPPCAEDGASRRSLYYEHESPDRHDDSGIESIQVSPSPVACSAPPTAPFPVRNGRRQSNALLHPDRARLIRPCAAPPSPDRTSVEDASASSSAASSVASVAAAATAAAAFAGDDGRRRSSCATAGRYSLFDALDLEYALLRAAARGSVGPCSLGESLHKLTFTQSLAFPALARGLAGKKRTRSRHRDDAGRALDAPDGGLNAFAKIVTALVLVLVSVLVFAVVYKFVRT